MVISRPLSIARGSVCSTVADHRKMAARFLLPLPLAGEHRPPSAAVLEEKRRSESSAMALGRARRVGEIFPRTPASVMRQHPHPGPPRKRGREQPTLLTAPYRAGMSSLPPIDCAPPQKVTENTPCPNQT